MLVVVGVVGQTDGTDVVSPPDRLPEANESDVVLEGSAVVELVPYDSVGVDLVRLVDLLAAKVVLAYRHRQPRRQVTAKRSPQLVIKKNINMSIIKSHYKRWIN